MTNFTLTRTRFGPNSTLGRLGAVNHNSDGVTTVDYFYTLEDAVREIPGVPVSEWKIKGRTAIPVGSYDLVIDYSNRFKRLMPHILKVPGFEGIRIHVLNTHEQTDGCPGVGESYRYLDDSKGGVDFAILNSRAAFDAFFPLLSKALEAGPCRIQVVGLPPVQPTPNPELWGEA